jgi:hypothetical protein
MTPVAWIEAVATLLWCYAGVTLLAWGGHLSRSDPRLRVAHVAEMIANLVPAMITLVVVVLVGAVIGLPSVVVLIAVLFPAGLAFGLHMALNEIRGEAPASWTAEIARLALAFAIGAAVIWWRQLG